MKIANRKTCFSSCMLPAKWLLTRDWHGEIIEKCQLWNAVEISTLKSLGTMSKCPKSAIAKALFHTLHNLRATATLPRCWISMCKRHPSKTQGTVNQNLATFEKTFKKPSSFAARKRTSALSRESLVAVHWSTVRLAGHEGITCEMLKIAPAHPSDKLHKAQVQKNVWPREIANQAPGLEK